MGIDSFKEAIVQGRRADLKILLVVFFGIVYAFLSFFASQDIFSFLIYGSLAIAVLSLATNNSGLLAFFFIVFFYTSSAIPVENQLFHIVDPTNICALALIFHFLLKLPLISHDYSALSINKKLAIYLILFVDIYTLYLGFKSDIVYRSAEEQITSKTLIKNLALSFGFIIMIVRLEKEKLHRYIDNGILTASVVLALSALLYGPLSAMGFDVWLEEGRSSGLHGGDENEFARILVITIGYCFARIESGGKKIKYLISILLIFAGVLGSGSRTAFLVSTLLLFVYLLRNLKKRGAVTIILSAAIIAVSYVSYDYFGSVMTNRLSDIHGDSGVNLGSRGRYWELYMQTLISRPYYLFFGSFGGRPLDRAEHNFYLALLYNGGFFLFLPFLVLIRKIMSYEKAIIDKVFSVRYSLLAYLVFSFTLSSPDFGYLALILGLSFNGHNGAAGEKVLAR